MDNLWLAEDDQFYEAPPWVPDPDSGDGIIRTDEQMQAWAEILGCTFRVATETELFVDLDSEAAWATFQHVFPVVREHFCGSPFTASNWQRHCVVTPSKSGLPKRHVVVRLATPQPLLVRIALQAALGSDGRRETISILRALRNEPNVVVFFEPKLPGGVA